VVNHAQNRQLRALRHIILDMDGTIYKGSHLFDFTAPFLALLTELGIGYTYLTNNSSHSVADYVRKLQQLGLPDQAAQIYTSGLATIDYLKDKCPELKTLFIVGTEALKQEFRAAGFTVPGDGLSTEPDAVIVGFDTSLTFDRLAKAGYWLQAGKPFIATHPDRICVTDQPTLLVDCGSICAALKTATGRAPDVVLGKPDPAMVWGIIKRHQLTKSEVAVVGDRLYTDMAMARQAGVMGILVLSGEAKQADLRNPADRPDLVIENIRQLGQLLKRSRSR